MILQKMQLAKVLCTHVNHNDYDGLVDTLSSHISRRRAMEGKDKQRAPRPAVNDASDTRSALADTYLGAKSTWTPMIPTRIFNLDLKA